MISSDGDFEPDISTKPEIDPPPQVNAGDDTPTLVIAPVHRAADPANQTRYTLVDPKPETEAANPGDEPLEGEKPIKYLLVLAVLVGVSTGIAWTIAGFLSRWIHTGIVQVVCLVLAVLVPALYVGGAWHYTRSNLLTEAKAGVPIGNDSELVDEWSAWPIRNALTINTQREATSDHLIEAVARLAFLPMFFGPLGALLALFALFCWLEISTPVRVSAIIWALVFLAPVVWAIPRTITWLRWRLVVTDLRVYIVLIGWQWMWWLDDNVKPLDLTKIQNCKADLQHPGWLSQPMKYGTLRLDGLGPQDDEDFNNIPNVKDVKKVVELLRHLTIAAALARRNARTDDGVS